MNILPLLPVLVYLPACEFLIIIPLSYHFKTGWKVVGLIGAGARIVAVVVALEVTGRVGRRGSNLGLQCLEPLLHRAALCVQHSSSESEIHTAEPLFLFPHSNTHIHTEVFPVFLL